MPHVASGVPTARYARWRLRQFVRAVRRTPVGAWHQVQWRTSDPDAITRWTERRLQLGDRFWLFILGLNNSGTSLLSHVLGRHPDVRSLPSAGQGLTAGLPRARDFGVSRNWTSRPEVFRWTEETRPEAALRVRYDWARAFPTREGILLEKSPPNTMRSRWLQRHFRPCRFVAIVRNPYAVCEGMRRREGIPIEEAALHWRRGHGYLLEDLPWLEQVLRLSYEGFCDDLAGHLARLETFLDLDRPIDRSVLDGTVPTHNLGGRPRPIANLNAESIARLSEADREVVGDVIGEMITRLGYERL
jgi:Sulfotransferase family